jgi:tetratricopeptide (TPR) repeat protein
MESEPKWQDSESMNTRCSIPLLTVAIVTLTCFVSGQTAIHRLPRQVLDARQLDEQGRPGEALIVLEPLVRENTAAWDRAIRGVACNLLGSIYRDMDRYDQARHFYEESIHILSSFPSEQQETASAIDNLGGLEELTGQLDAAKALRLRALHLYEKIKNHAGIALASSNLANLALKQRNLSAANRWVKKTFDELPLTIEMDEGNVAAIYTVKGALARSERSFIQAIQAYQHAIELLTQECGPDCSKLGKVYTLRGEAYGLAGDYLQAEADFQRAISILKVSSPNSKTYWQSELAYASMLHSAGSQVRAGYLERDARLGLRNLERVQCGGCTITAESFR